jgi:hypothetical protein
MTLVAFFSIMQYRNRNQILIEQVYECDTKLNKLLVPHGKDVLTCYATWITQRVHILVAV